MYSIILTYLANILLDLVNLWPYRLGPSILCPLISHQMARTEPVKTKNTRLEYPTVYLEGI